jgi:nitrogen fixation NifU-like protein
MAGAEDIYQRLILEHSRAPRNRGPLEGADAAASRDNPLCGDAFTVSLALGDGGGGGARRIAAVRFEGVGCAISVASASMMTAAVEGRTPDEARAIFARFDHLVSGEPQPDIDMDLGELDAFAAVARLPVRAKCARLPWQALLDALAAAPPPPGV